MRRILLLLCLLMPVWASAAPSSTNSIQVVTGQETNGQLDWGILGNGAGGSIPLPITGSITASNPSVGTNAATAPTSSTAIGITVSGNLQAVSAANPLPVSATLAAPTLSTASTSALASNLVAKSGAGTLYSFEASADTTLAGAAWWLMIFAATAAPSDGAVTPLKCYAFPAGTTGFSAAFPNGIAIATGITLVTSSAGCFTKTASAHAFISADYQ